MLNGDSSFEFLSGMEDRFGPKAHDVRGPRIRPERHFLKPGEVEIEPTRLHPPRAPLTEQEIDDILADLEREMREDEL